MSSTITNSPHASLDEARQPKILRILHILRITPLATLLIYCGLSVGFKENFPFSNFPMYSNPSSERFYFTLSGPDGKGLPIQTLTGTTDPKIGKILRTKSAVLREQLKVKNLTREQEEGIGREMIARFRREAMEHGNTLPEHLQLNQILIDYRDGQIVETPVVYAKEN